MMRLTWKDGLAMLSVGCGSRALRVVGDQTAMTGISTRALGVIVLGLGFVACTSASAEMAEVYGADASRRPLTTYVVIASLVGFVALVAGVITLVGGSEATLATLVVAMIVLWAMSTVRHTRAGRESAAAAHTIQEPLDRMA